MKEDMIDCQAFLAGDTLWWIFSGPRGIYGAVAVSVIGDFTGAAPNNAALDAVRNILDCAVQEGVLAADYELFGHRDGGCTACPGDMLYSEIRTWPEYSFKGTYQTTVRSHNKAEESHLRFTDEARRVYK
ncbi:hypothetical protein LSH36_170g04027 [Paralvinella palmiformis]|uniref:Peptidoglycan recognition protein family domain-containing protein n=1 Tax=Paralvinella palmiformis TaxID=53620 RepID=A0AAD9JTM1_9ANNE|nr:hypothetical protein LSH36_170g04027 [Paralvinella palmiformis]